MFSLQRNDSHALNRGFDKCDSVRNEARGELHLFGGQCGARAGTGSLQQQDIG